MLSSVVMEQQPLEKCFAVAVYRFVYTSWFKLIMGKTRRLKFTSNNTFVKLESNNNINT